MYFGTYLPWNHSIWPAVSSSVTLTLRCFLRTNDWPICTFVTFFIQFSLIQFFDTIFLIQCSCTSLFIGTSTSFVTACLLHVFVSVVHTRMVFPPMIIFWFIQSSKNLFGPLQPLLVLGISWSSFGDPFLPKKMKFCHFLFKIFRVRNIFDSSSSHFIEFKSFSPSYCSFNYDRTLISI